MHSADERMRLSHTHKEETRDMSPSIRVIMMVSALLTGSTVAANAQGMLLDYAADRVIQKVQTQSCQELKQHRDDPKSEKEKAALEFLRTDSQARIAFIDKIAAPVANKMFECGMFP